MRKRPWTRNKQNFFIGPRFPAFVYYPFYESFREKGLLFRYELDNEEFTTDKSAFFQLLFHLLDNAVNFSKTGTIRLIIEVENDLFIRVSDEGIGIPEDNNETIFDLLQQGEDCYSKQYPGIGEGLTIVRDIVKALNGKIQVNYSEGKGSSFHLNFL